MTTTAPSLVLMGLRGSGKSTLGRLVAQRTGLAFVDLDLVTTALLGEGTLAELWAQHGEAAFREAEARALRVLVLAGLSSRGVGALGGGTPTAPGAAGVLEQAVEDGRIELVYLRGDPALLRERLAGADPAERPTLTGAGTLAEVEQVFAARDGLYARLASRVIEIEGRTIEQLAGELHRILGK